MGSVTAVMLEETGAAAAVLPSSVSSSSTVSSDCHSSVSTLLIWKRYLREPSSSALSLCSVLKSSFWETLKFVLSRGGLELSSSQYGCSRSKYASLIMATGWQSRVADAGPSNVLIEDRPRCGAGWNLKQAHDVPERTGKGDAIAGVAKPFIAIGFSSSSSGEIVSSDWLTVSPMRHQYEQ